MKLLSAKAGVFPSFGDGQQKRNQTMDILGNPENGDVHGNLIDSDIHGHAPGMDVHGSEPHDVFGHYDPQAGSSFDGGGIGEVLGDLFGFLLGG